MKNLEVFINEIYAEHLQKKCTADNTAVCYEDNNWARF